jgi:ABC-type bacteriocin/lantibiotic exporters, contain an N-terminal double-glycine peptidase domain
MKTLIALVSALARRQRIELDPNWAAPAESLMEEKAGEDALAALCSAVGWERPERLRKLPRAQHFPLLVFHPVEGWAIADQWSTATDLRVLTPAGVQTWPTEEVSLAFYRVRVPGERAKNAVSRSLQVFLRAVLQRRRMLVEAAVSTVVISVASLGVSLFAMQVYDRVIPQRGLSTLWVLLFGAMFAIGVELLLRWLRAISLEREAASIDAEVSEFFFQRLQALRLDARPGTVGTLAAQMRGLEQVRSVMSAASVYFIADLPFALLMIWVIAQIGGSVAFVPLIGLPIVLLFAWGVSKAVRREAKQGQVSSYRKNGLLVEAIAANEVVKATRGHWDLLARWNKLVDDVTTNDERVRRWSALTQSVANGGQQVVYVLMVAWGSLLVMEGEITMGALIACSMIAGRVNGPLLAQLPGLLTQWSYARSALEGLDQLLALPVDRDPDGDYLRPASLRGPIVVDSVRFAYAGARNGLEIPKLAINPGERVAIVGPVGSGKSTLLKLLAGIFRPQSGTVLLAGLDMQQIAEETLREHVGYLPQDYRLVQGSLRENLLLGMADPGDDAIMECAAKTGLAQFIAAHPKGLDMPISEGGGGVSGGQRQLIGLTRLLLAKPHVWLLDEPTASLDQESEQRSLKAVEASTDADDIVVLVTHKMSLLRLVQRVIVVAQGKIVMDGPAAQVLKQLSRPAPASSTAAVAAVAGRSA